MSRHDGTNVWTHHYDEQEVHAFGPAVGFGPDFVGANEWVHEFTAE